MGERERVEPLTEAQLNDMRRRMEDGEGVSLMEKCQALSGLVNDAAELLQHFTAAFNGHEWIEAMKLARMIEISGHNMMHGVADIGAQISPSEMMRGLLTSLMTVADNPVETAPDAPDDEGDGPRITMFVFDMGDDGDEGGNGMPDDPFNGEDPF